MGLREDFTNPPNQYRPIPFWSWNDTLENDELKEQIHHLKQGGNGGFFMHARSGLKTEYLSEEWFAAIKTGLDQAREENMHAWIYDEEGWPSGFAGGIVPALTSEFHAKFITMEQMKPDSVLDHEKILAAYRFHKKSGTFILMKTMDFDAVKKEQIFLIYKHANPYYIDTLNEQAVSAFINCTHQAYYEHFKDSFGKELKGFFTDEPRLTCDHFGEIAWSDTLPEYFQKYNGYDILEHLPMLFIEAGAYEKIRYDFWLTVNKMFSEHYMKQIYDWCGDHQCKVTGHIMMEESIFSQMTSTAGVMPFYEYLHIPGIDWLRRRIDSPVIAKQVGSVACQLGKKQVLTESFALCGWNVSLEELKWIAEWQFINGVNQICQHLMAYSMKGVRKRDYPPSHFTQQTWYEEASKFNDYLSRLCVALSEGDEEADVLLLHPMRSGYLAYNGTRTQKMKELDEAFQNVSLYLSNHHISYHYGDETILSKYGEVTQEGFRVGRICYKTILLPTMYALDGSTVSRLLQFAQNGGKIVALGEFPYFTNTDKSKLYDLEQVVLKMSCNKLRSFLESEKLLSLSITEDGKEITSISYLLRRTSQGNLYFLVNHDQEKSFQATVRFFEGEGSILQFIAESGEVKMLESKLGEDETQLMLSFRPMQSYLLLFSHNLTPILMDERGENHTKQELITRVRLGNQWELIECAWNSLTLDQCKYRIDQDSWHESIPLIHLQEKLLEMKQPVTIELLFDFEISMDLTENKEFYLVVEDIMNFEITVNQRNVHFVKEDITWWKDKSFQKIDIKHSIIHGKNEIRLKTRFAQPQKVYDVLYGENVYETEKNKITYGTELENIYLLGDFGVVSKTPFQELDRGAMRTKGPFEIVNLQKTFSNNDFTREGLLFFAGSCVIRQTIRIDKINGERVILEFGKQNAPVMDLSVNKKQVKISMWEPYESDITDVVTEGENVVEIKLYASNRNLLGPHHHSRGECYNVGPESFTGRWSWVERESESDATDIADRNQSFWSDEYCFVKFGLSDDNEE